MMTRLSTGAWLAGNGGRRFRQDCWVPRRLDEATERQLGKLLKRQRRAVSRKQVMALGISDAMIRARLASGHWQAAFPGTYIAHNGDVAYLSLVWAALLYAGTDAIASYDTAAYLHGLIATPPIDVHVTVPASRRVTAHSGLVIHLASRAADQEQPFSAPVRTRVEETVLDLAETKTRPDDVAGVLTNACQKRKTTVLALRAGVEQRKKLRHRGLINEILTAIAGGAESVLEWRYYRDVERPHGLPKGRRQLTRRRNGKGEALDVVYEAYQVIVELDGEAFHLGKQRVRDRARDNHGVVHDHATLRYGWPELTTAPCDTARQVGELLRKHGWRGTFRHCPRCRSRNDGP